MIDDDLDQLGTEIPTSKTMECGNLPWPDSLASALGCMYVLEGSAMGGRVVAYRAQTKLDEKLPVSFFTSAGRSQPQRDWRAFQQSLDFFGAFGSYDARETLSREHFRRLRRFPFGSIPRSYGHDPATFVRIGSGL
jgi:heme oxygenase